MCLSVPQIAAAATRISTSSGPGFGTGQSRISVPDAPSTGVDLTTACMASGGGCYHVAERTSREAQGAVDDLFAQPRSLQHSMRIARQLARESIDRSDHPVAIAIPQVFVQSAFNAVDLLARGSARLVHRICHPAGAGLIVRAVEDQHRHTNRAQR